MDAVLRMGRVVVHAPEAAGVGLVFREEKLRRALAGQREATVVLAVRVDRGVPRVRFAGPQPLAPRAEAPRPGVAKPDRRQHVHGRGLGAAIENADADEDVVRRRLRVLGEDVEVAAVIKDPRVEELELGVAPGATPVLVEQLLVRELALRVLVQRLHVGVGRRRIEIVVALLDVLAVVALGAREAEEALLQDRVLPVPEGDREADVLVAVRNPHQAVFTPAVGPRAGVVVREGVPGATARAVVLAHGPPLALGQVGPPALPVVGALQVLLEPQSLRVGVLRHPEL